MTITHPMLRRITAAFLTAALLAGPASAQPNTLSPRPSAPRVTPVPEAERTPEQKSMIAARGNMNLYTTLARHTDLYARWTPLGQFLLNGSSLPVRDREMLMLRMGWLCQADYEWAAHSRIATTSAGVTPAEIHRIAEGPKARGWSDFDRALLQASDDIRYDAMISDATRATLKTRYSDNQILEALYTAAQYQLVSMVLNSLGIQDDADMTLHLPKDVAQPRPAARPSAERLKTPRVPPLALAQMTPDQRTRIADKVSAQGTVMNLYATLITHPKLYTPRTVFGSYLQKDDALPPRIRELVIMRTSYENNAPYEWAHHIALAKQAGYSDADITRIVKGGSAPGWDEDQKAALLAVDELRRDAFISNATWALLTKHFNTQRILEIIYTSGGYAMTASAINSLGIQIEPGFEARPWG